jgi:hypothetical protein
MPERWNPNQFFWQNGLKLYRWWHFEHFSGLYFNVEKKKKKSMLKTLTYLSTKVKIQNPGTWWFFQSCFLVREPLSSKVLSRELFGFCYKQSMFNIIENQTFSHTSLNTGSSSRPTGQCKLNQLAEILNLKKKKKKKGFLHKVVHHHATHKHNTHGIVDDLSFRTKHSMKCKHIIDHSLFCGILWILVNSVDDSDILYSMHQQTAF